MPPKVAKKIKFDPANIHMLLSPERKQMLDVYKLLSALPIMPYHQVADVGCGPGYFTIPLGKYLFEGKLFAFDIQQKMLAATENSLEKVHLSNVEVIKSKESKLPLDDDTLDGALMAFVLQEATYPSALLKETARCLKNSGWIAILEWHKKESEDGPPIEQRIDKKELIALIEKVGLRFRLVRDINPSQYILLAAK